MTLNYIDQYEFRIGTFSETAVIQTVSANLQWGAIYTTPDGYKIRVDEPDLQSTYDYEDYQGNIEEREPDSGNQWAFVTGWVKNETGQTAFSPLASEIVLLVGSSQYDGRTIAIDEPFNKGQPFNGGNLQPDVERSGWILYEIPGKINIDDVVVAWSESTFEGDISVNWSSQ